MNTVSKKISRPSIGYLLISGQNFTLKITRAPLVVGRQSDCNYVLSHPACSARHFRIYSTVFEEGGSEPLIFCEDLHSTNGTYVNNRRMDEGASVLLLPGDTIEIKAAAAEFLFRARALKNPNELDGVSEREKYVFEDFYSLTNKLLGEGGYGAVCLGYEKKTGNQVACKIVDLKRLEQMAKDKERQKQTKKIALREAEILVRLKHPNIVDVRRVFVTTNRVYIFQELVTYGDLFSLMAERGALSETDAMAIVWQILKGLAYMHENNVVHRDLKPENILCTSKNIGSRIILADFGAARFMNIATRLTSIHGTLEFAAPEMLRPAKTGYSTAVDLWSLGVITHQLLSGYPPFQHRTDTQCKLQVMELIEAITNSDMRHLDTEYAWRDVSQYAKDFVRKLICIDQKERLSARMAMKHPWLARHTKELDALYERSNRGWKKPDGEAIIEEWQTSNAPFQLAVIRETLPVEPNPEPEPESIVLEPVLEAGLDWGDLDESCPPTPTTEDDITMLHQSPPPSLDYENIYPQQVEESMYSLQEQELYDTVVRDGRLRNAKEIWQEVQDRKAENVLLLSEIESIRESSFGMPSLEL